MNINNDRFDGQEHIIYLQGFKSFFENAILSLMSFKVLIDLLIFYQLNKSLMDLIFFSIVWIGFTLWTWIYFSIVLKRKIIEIKILQSGSLLKMKSGVVKEKAVSNELDTLDKKIQVGVRKAFLWKVKLLIVVFFFGLITSIIFCSQSLPLFLQ